MKYCTDDGKKIFNTEKEFFEYEQKLKAEKVRKEKVLKEKANRLDEIQKQSKILQDLVIKYYEDFGSMDYKTQIGVGVFNDIFQLLRFV